jgi:N-acyl-D-amino-acid deacylase
MDVIVRGALVVDGTGAPPFHGDVGISGDAIVAVGDLGVHAASKKIDGANLIAAPGFIDMHSHSDFTLPNDPRSMSKVSQGVTTEVIGNCGVTPAPVADTHREEWIESVSFLPGELSWNWRSFGDFLDRLRKAGLGVNVFPLVGHGAIRTAVMGMVDEEPSPSQLEQMAQMLSECLMEGALGMSTGLIYPPGVYSQLPELVQLARVAGNLGGLYFSHIRGEGATLLDAIEEAASVGREASLPVQVGHLKASGRANWDKFDGALTAIERARESGVDVTFDLYPYTAGNTVITALLPPWLLAGGVSATLERLKDSDLRQRITTEMTTQELVRETPWDRIMIASCRARRDYVGKLVQQLAEEAGEPPSDWVLDFVVRCRGEADIILFSQSEENVRKGLGHPVSMIGTDGCGLTTTGALAEGRPHPRNYGTYARVLGHYVRDEKVLRIEEAVAKMTSVPASRLRLNDRGKLCPGFKADIVLFDAAIVNDMCEYGRPPRYARGIPYVLVNGQLVIEEGEHCGRLPGRILGPQDLAKAHKRPDSGRDTLLAR